MGFDKAVAFSGRLGGLGSRSQPCLGAYAIPQYVVSIATVFNGLGMWNFWSAAKVVPVASWSQMKLSSGFIEGVNDA